MLVLALETSCDETAAAVVSQESDGRYVVHSSVVSSQIALHARYGGVVPEIASRAHVAWLNPVISQALAEADVTGRDLDVVAATAGPGLIGALLVGVSTAKALALVWDKPYVGVNHLEGHLFAPLLEDPVLAVAAVQPGAGAFPLVVLLVSGGHTLLLEMRRPGDYRLLGQTLDDAAGEAFDKVARFLGLGYPGGPAIDKLAEVGRADAIPFPRSMLHDGLDFSFSGLKTSVINHVRRNPGVVGADVAASFQQAVVDVLVAKARRAANEVGAVGLSLAGGVAANTLLRQRWLEMAERDGRRAYLPSRVMCTDNAAMIGAAALWRFRRDGPTALDAGASPGLRLSFTT